MAHRICLFLTILVLLVSCQTPPPASTATQSPTKEIMATATAATTSTAVSATNTPSPTATAIPALTTPIPLGGLIHNPLNGDKIHPNEPFVIEFDQVMAIDSAATPLLFVPEVDGDFSWDAAGKTVTFTPEQGFIPNRSYTVRQAPDLITQAGVADELVWQIGTLPAPQVHWTANPRTTQMDDDLLISAGLNFNKEMDWQSVVEAFSVEPPVPLVLNWLENGRLQQTRLNGADATLLEVPSQRQPKEKQLLIQMQVPFDLKQPYQLTLAETAVDSEHHVPLTNPFQDEIQITPLQADLAQTVGALQLRLNYLVDLEQAVAALHIEPPLEANWQARWQDNETVLSLDTSDHLLPAAQAYTFSFQAPLLHKSGTLLTKPGPVFFTTDPIVAKVSPRGDDWSWGEFNPETPLEVTFSRLMDKESVEAAFQIKPEVEGEFHWDGATLVFQPEKGFLEGNTGYNASFDTSVKEVNGDPVFTQPYSWHFATGDLHTDADFGIGTKVQVVDANGRRGLQYRSYQTEPISVTFGLYDLNQQQALQTLRGEWLDSQTLPQVITWTAVTDPREFDNHRYINPQETLIPAEVPPGAYLITTDAGPFHDDLLLFLSGNTVAAKKAGEQVTVWTTDINGDVAAELDVMIVDEKGQTVANGRSSAEGLFQTELAPETKPMFVLVTDDRDVVATGLDGMWRTGYGYTNGAPDTLINVYTDRPIYRPGQTVYFKALLRHNDDAQMEPLPANSAVTARIQDSRKNVVQTFALETNQFGTVNGQFGLAEGAMLGVYRLEIVAPDGRTVSQPFRVEDYRKPEYEVIVTTDADKYLIGDMVSVTVDSTYFFGEPLVNAAVAVTLFSGGWDVDEPIQGTTDDNGRFTLSLTPTQGGHTIEATVDDGTHQSVSAATQIYVHAEAETVSLNLGSYLKAPDDPIEAEVFVNDVFGQPVANRVVDLELLHRDPSNWALVKVADFQGETDENGRYRHTFTPAEMGYYTLYARITDRLGNQLRTYRLFMVYDSANRYSRWFTSPDDLKISGDPDSAVYTPGETAQLFIQSTQAGPAVVTLERADVRSQQLITLTPPLTVVDIDITENDAPNIYASVMAWKKVDSSQLGEDSIPESQLLVSTLELPVSVAHKTLNIEILPDKERYQPGDDATFTLRVTNNQGDPASAELSLAMVDEAIFSLSPDLSPTLFDTFHFRRNNQISNYQTFMPQRRLWYYVGYDYGGMGGGGGGDDLRSPAEPRREFKDTAAWYPALETDANGEVTVTIKLPDNLTSWRLTAKGATADTQVGETSLNVTTWKPIILRPALPRILTAGDTLLLSSLIHNNTDGEQSATVTLSLENPLLAGDTAAQTVTIPANNMTVVGWPLTAVAAGTVTLTMQAENEGIVLDAIELPLEIQPLTVPDVTTIQGQLTNSLTTEINWPNAALPISTVQIDLNRSIAGSMVQGLEYLTGYPYGCVEQTMSRALPNTVVARAFSQLGVSDPHLLADLEPLINASVQRLYSFQHSDGGWGWWIEDATHDYQTAWVVFGLTTTADAGYEVDPAVIERGANWLTTHLDEMDMRTRAFALYSLAISGYGNVPYTLATAAESGLDRFSQAALALTLDELGETAVARELVDDLAATATEANGLVYWPSDGEDGRYRQKIMASTTRNTALALSAFVTIRPGHELEPGIVRYLMNQRQPRGWGSTNETAFTILALTDHLLAAQEAAGEQNTDYTVSLNGQVVMSGTLAPDILSAKLFVPAEQLQVGDNELVIDHEGKLYYQVSSRVYLAQEAIEAAGGVAVSRVYRDGLTGEVVTAVVPNQLVQVELTVTLPAAASYMIVEDNLPGGFEAMNENLDTTTLAAREDNRPYWEWRGYNYKEIRDNRVSFFITDMDEGEHTFTYYARATHEGDFIAMPAEAYAMYDAAVWGRSASEPILVTGTE